MYNIPQIQTLRTFAIAAKVGNFSRAAEQLGISQGAVSQHIKSLELRIGFKVFTRHPHGIEITPSGKALLNATESGLSQIEQTIKYERNRQKQTELVISVHPGFAVQWLFKRMIQFNQSYPHVKIHINAITNPIDFISFDAHAAIHYHAIDPLKSKPLLSEQLVLVCSPAYFKTQNLSKLKSTQHLIDALPNLRLLGEHVEDNMLDFWAYWGESYHIDVRQLPLQRSTQSNITLQLAELDYGIALGRTSLVMDALHTGRLVAVPKQPPLLDSLYAYSILENTNAPHNKYLKTFCDWLSASGEEITSFTQELQKQQNDGRLGIKRP